MNQKGKKTVKFIIKLLISLAFIAWLVFKVNWDEVFDYLAQVKLWQILAYIFFYLIGIWISAVKWKNLADYKKIKTNIKECYQYYLAGTLVNNFLPSFVGGDTFRSYQLGKTNEGKYVEAASTVLVDRITGFIGVMVMVLLFSVINIKTTLANPLLIVINILIVLSFVPDVFIVVARKFRFWKKIKQIIPQIIIQIFQEIRGYSQNHAVLKKAILWGMLFNFVGVAMANFVLFYAFGIKINIIDYLTVIFMISIISAIPISINNIGVKEWAYITLFGLFGINSAAVVSIAILSRFLQMAVSFLALPVYLRSKE
jgi:glycosyltransferase 2 family protein